MTTTPQESDSTTPISNSTNVESIPIGGSTLPPRPNPGPEPWPEPSGSPWIWWTVGSLGLALMVVVLLIVRRRKRLRTRQPDLANPEVSDPPIEIPGPDDGRGRLLAAAGVVHRALAARLGPTSRAKTTAEIAEDSRLVEWLGIDKSREVVRLLERADYLKFSGVVPPELAQGGGSAEVDASEALAESVRSAVGATSKTTGR